MKTPKKDDAVKITDEASVEPNWLKPRLERERKKALKDAGLLQSDFDAIREKLEDANKALAYIMADLFRTLTPAEIEEVCDAGNNEPLATYMAIVALRKTNK